MDVVPTNTIAVPDSAFPFASTELEALAGLIDPPASPAEIPLGDLKLGSMQGDDGYFPCYPYSSFPFEPDPLCSYYEWMRQDILLPTPEEQGTDAGPFLPPPPASYSSLPTPESSNPATPTFSNCQDPEVMDALSLIDGSPTSQPAEILPQFDGQSPLPSPASYTPSSVTYSPSLANYDFPPSAIYDPAVTESFLPSPLPSSAQDFSPKTNYSFSVHSDSPLPTSPDTASSTKPEGIRDLLIKTEDTPVSVSASTSCKRKTVESATTPASDGVRVKRKKLSKVAKKERKMEQNKQAALRYRHRKKGETEEIDDRKEELEALNSDLKKKVNSLASEIAYLKNLWSEIEAAKAQKAVTQLAASND